MQADTSVQTQVCTELQKLLWTQWCSFPQFLPNPLFLQKQLA